MKALQSRYDETTSVLSASSHLDFAGCRLQAHASALRADLVRDVEARLLMPSADDACPKPIRLYVPPRSHDALDQTNSSPAVHSAAVEDSPVAASCVLTVRGELLVADHTDEGLSSLRPRSLGFIAQDTILPPPPNPSGRGQKLRRYPIVLMVSCSALRRRDGHTAGRDAAVELSASDKVAMTELRLFAPSLNQYAALRQAIESWSAKLHLAQIQSLPVLCTISDEEDKSEDDAGGTRDSPADAVLHKSLDARERVDGTHTGKRDNLFMAEIESKMTALPLQTSKAISVLGPGLAAERRVLPFDTNDLAGSVQSLLSVSETTAQINLEHCSDSSKTKCMPDMDRSSGQLLKQINAVRENLWQTMSRASRAPLFLISSTESTTMMSNFLSSAAAGAEKDVHSLAAATAAAKDLSRFTLGSLKGSLDRGYDIGLDTKGDLDTDLLDPRIDGTLRLTAQLELRAIAAGLLEGLDAALVLEIRHLAEENALLRAHLRRFRSTAFSMKAGTETNATPAERPITTPAERPIIVSGQPTSLSFVPATEPEGKVLT